jgi:hypothetical protein
MKFDHMTIEQKNIWFGPRGSQEEYALMNTHIKANLNVGIVPYQDWKGKT